MSSLIKFVQMHETLTEREAQYKREALQQAKDRAHVDRLAMYRELNELVRVDGMPIARVCKETGLSRSTVYRWLEDHDRITTYVKPDDGSHGWTDVQLMPSGEVRAKSPAGEVWVLSGDGEAWNKSTNEIEEPISNWPDGAKDAFDSVQPGE